MTLTEDLALSNDPAAWAEQVHGLTLDPWQKEALRDPSPRLLFNVSRQAGKTLVDSILAAHCATYVPHSLSLIVCPSLRQSMETFRVTRSLLTVPSTSFSLSRIETTLDSRIIALPASEETLRGFSAVNLLIFDEAARTPDDVYVAMRPMLAVSSGREILSSTPAGCRGVFYVEWKTGQGWRRYEVTGEDCPRIPPEFLEEEKRRLGELLYAQEYMCRFIADQAAVFDPDTVDSLFVDIPPLFQGRTA